MLAALDLSALKLKATQLQKLEHGESLQPERSLVTYAPSRRRSRGSPHAPPGDGALRRRRRVGACITDGGWLMMILINFLSNAFKNTRNGAVDVHITVERGGSNDQRLRISVADNGVGVPEHLVPRLFEQFSQGAVEGRHRPRAVHGPRARARARRRRRPRAKRADGRVFWVAVPHVTPEGEGGGGGGGGGVEALRQVVVVKPEQCEETFDYRELLRICGDDEGTLQEVLGHLTRGRRSTGLSLLVGSGVDADAAKMIRFEAHKLKGVLGCVCRRGAGGGAALRGGGERGHRAPATDRRPCARRSGLHVRVAAAAPGRRQGARALKGRPRKACRRPRRRLPRRWGRCRVARSSSTTNR